MSKEDLLFDQWMWRIAPDWYLGLWATAAKVVLRFKKEPQLISIEWTLQSSETRSTIRLHVILLHVNVYNVAVGQEELANLQGFVQE